MKFAIIIAGILATVVFGSCTDVPIDSDSAVVKSQDPHDTLIPPVHRDTCYDCLTARRRSPVNLLMLYFKNAQTYRTDSVEVNIVADRLRGDFAYLKVDCDDNNAEFDIALRFETTIPSMNSANPMMRNLQRIHVSVPSMHIKKYLSNDEDVRLSPFENHKVPGAAILYCANDTTLARWFVTGEAFENRNKKSHGNLRIIRLDTVHRFIDAGLHLVFYFPESYYPTGNIEPLTFEVKFRLGYE